MKPRIIEFEEFGDERGRLVVAESNRNIPFAIKRSFWIFGSDPGVSRGKHANELSEFVLVCVSGSCRVKTVDSEGAVADFVLDSPAKGLFVPRMAWKEMYSFSSDAVMLVLSSEHYDETEYIHDYTQWKRMLSKDN